MQYPDEPQHDRVQIGGGDDAGERLVERWGAAIDRKDEIVPRYGFTQAEREVAAAGRPTGA